MKLLKLSILLLFFSASPILAQDLKPKGVNTEIKVKKLSTAINSQFDEIMPVLSNTGKELFFTRVGSDDYQRSLLFQGEDLFWSKPYNWYLKSLRKTYEQISGLQISDPIHSKYNQDIWVAKILEDGSIGKVSNLPTPVNSALPNSLCSTTPNNTAFIVMNQFFPKGGMQAGFSVIHQLADGNWSFPKPIDIEGFNVVRQDINLTLSKDGTTLLLSMANRDTKGLQDLYVSFLKPSGKWSRPLNLGHQVNSSWKETSPYLAKDNRTLFFSSSRRDIYGGVNLYSTIRLDDTWQNWSKPTILVKPVNSEFDESQPVFDFDSGMLFFSSNRDGQSDIYKVKITHPTADLETDINEYVALEGRVLDENGWMALGAKIMYRPYNFGEYKEVANAEDGTFAIRVPKGRKVHLKAVLEDYEGKEKHLYYRTDYKYFKAQHTTLYVQKNPDELVVNVTSKDTVKKPNVNTFIVREKAQKTKRPTVSTTASVKKRKGRKIELKPIYFQRSKDRILRKSYGELNKLVQLLKKHPTMLIRVEGHTDSNGDPLLLEKLSTDRAVAIKAYLINRGIQETRIKTVGFGGEYPVIENDSEYNRRKNRRVDVYVVNKVEGLEFSELNQREK